MVTAPWVMIKVPRDLAQIKLDLGESNGLQIGGATIYTNGGAIIRPGNYDRIGGGSIDPRNASTGARSHREFSRTLILKGSTTAQPPTYGRGPGRN